MVATRRSSRIVNKAKIEQTRVTRRKMLTEELVSDDDFQDPIVSPTESTMALRRSPRKRLRTSTSGTSISSISTSVSAASSRKTRSRQTSVIIESQAHTQESDEDESDEEESDEEESDEEEINTLAAASSDNDEEETIDSGIVTASEQLSDSVADSLEPESEYEFARLESQDEQYQLEETQEPETEVSQSAQTSSSSSDEEEQLMATRRRRFVRRQRDPVVGVQNMIIS